MRQDYGMQLYEVQFTSLGTVHVVARSFAEVEAVISSVEDLKGARVSSIKAAGRAGYVFVAPDMITL